MTAPLCNHCKHYRPAFPGYCAALSEYYPERCVVARSIQTLSDDSGVNCGPDGWHFEPRKQEAA